MGDDNKLAEQLNKLKLLMIENSKVLEQYKKINLKNKGLITSAEIERINNLESQVKDVNGRILELEIKKGISSPNQTDKLSDKFTKAFEAYKKACEAGTLSNEEAKILLQTMKSELASLANSFNLMSAEYKNNKSEVLKTELNSLSEKIKKYSADYRSLSRDCIKDAVVEKSAEKKDNFEKKEIYENINDQKCFAIFLSDSGSPQKVGNSWKLTRTIERKEVDCNKEYGFINIEGSVYKSDLSLDELMKSSPNFEEHLYANKGFSKEEFLAEVRQQSVTWKKYRDFETGLKLKGETKISFPVVWDLTPGINTNGQEEGNISLFLEKRKALIEKIYSDVSVCDTLEAQKSYFLFLM